MRVGIVGGTGDAGRGIALRLAAAGNEVCIGSRSSGRGAEVCAKMNHPHVSAADNLGATSFGDVVILAVPWNCAGETVASLGETLVGRVVVSMASAVNFANGDAEAIVSPSGSLALGIQVQIPKSHVVASLHHLPARVMRDGNAALDFDVLTCGDDGGAVDTVMRLINSIEGLRAINAGRLVNAAALEALTPVLIGLNRRYRARTGIKISGIIG